MFQHIILKNNMQDRFSLSEVLISDADIASFAALLPQIEECFRTVFSLQMYLHINQVNPPSPQWSVKQTENFSFEWSMFSRPQIISASIYYTLFNS